ncbi:MAG TPA: hypothetical protein VMS12_09450 [Thermoanaerobaculia bacterium]|nr:hypothetical protein [Thermoanaerobaculia bacterium]
MRNEMVGAVVRRAIEHPEFRAALMEDPELALHSHGFALESDDLAEIQKIQRTLGEKDGADVEQELVTIAEEYGIQPAGKN